MAKRGPKKKKPGETTWKSAPLKAVPDPPEDAPPKPGKFLPPRGMSQRARGMWRTLAARLEAAGSLNMTDPETLALAAEHYAIAADAADQIKKHGVFIQDKKGSMKKNPALQAGRDYFKSYMEFLKNMGLFKVRDDGDQDIPDEGIEGFID